MDGRDWPEPVRTLRGYLPAEMRLLRGALGAVGGVVVLGGVLVVLLGGNWQLGYGDDRVLVSIFLVLAPAAVGVASPAWYWVGRPVWHRLGRPGDRPLRPFRRVRFLPGLVGSVVGVALLFPVSATSRFPEQVLAPFGLAVALASPLWFWLLRPAVGGRVEARLPGALRESSPTATVLRVLPVVGVLLLASAAVTAAIALPVVGPGEQIGADGLAVTVTDTRTATAVTAAGDGLTHGDDARRLLLVRVAVENRGDAPRRLPGTSVGDISVIAPECRAQNFGEPSNNCNQVFVDGDFRSDGIDYANYEALVEAADGTVEPGSRVSGWLVFRVESPPNRAPGFEAMVVVDDVGRWTLDDGWRDGGVVG